MPPTAFILRITQETAGVDMMPFWPITRWPICSKEHKYTQINAHRHVYIGKRPVLDLSVAANSAPHPSVIVYSFCYCMLAAQITSYHWVTLKIRVQAMIGILTRCDVYFQNKRHCDDYRQFEAHCNDAIASYPHLYIDILSFNFFSITTQCTFKAKMLNSKMTQVT